MGNGCPGLGRRLTHTFGASRRCSRVTAAGSPTAMTTCHPSWHCTKACRSRPVASASLLAPAPERTSAFHRRSLMKHPDTRRSPCGDHVSCAQDRVTRQAHRDYRRQTRSSPRPTGRARRGPLATFVQDRQPPPAHHRSMNAHDAQHAQPMHVDRDGPRDAPPLLLIHGSGASSASWEPVVPALAARHHVVRTDLPGCGQSPRATSYDVPAQAGRVSALLDELGLRAVTVAGHSSGGYVATALAEQRPDLVGSLAMISTGPHLGRFVWISAQTRGRCSRCEVRPGRWSRSSRSGWRYLATVS
ncbi:alpha/beta fold hydrolase, partial [Streptomyces salinarius]|uniref:alpha/beta fold hydrolase n=1 Tax=Streptomyces salinarius TaxID=2762598 RepID=UPI003D7F96D2